MENQTSPQLCTPIYQSLSWIKQGDQLTQELFNFARNAKLWTLQKKTAGGDELFSHTESSKILMLHGILHSHITNVKTKLVDKVETMPEWNRSVTSFRVVEKCSSTTTTDICHIQLKGVRFFMSPRDFVVLRSTQNLGDGWIVLAIQSVTHTGFPSTPGFVRGSYGLNGWVFRELPGNQTEFYWVVDVDVKLSSLIPMKIVETKAASEIITTLTYLKGHLAN